MLTIEIVPPSLVSQANLFQNDVPPTVVFHHSQALAGELAPETEAPAHEEMPAAVAGDIVHDRICDDEAEPLDVTLLDLSCRNTDDDWERLSKRMIEITLNDLRGETYGSPDLLGQISSEREARKMDALCWIYDLNPDGARLTFARACAEIGINAYRFRSVLAPLMRRDLCRLLKVLACMVSDDHAFNCECSLGDYVNLTGWQTSH